jgi:hypothetical protein
VSALLAEDVHMAKSHYSTIFEQSGDRIWAVIRVTPVIDGDRALVEWWAAFHCAAEEYDHWTVSYTDSFARWLGSLRNYLAG